MAEEELRLVATFVDNVSGPLSDVEQKMKGLSGAGGEASPIGDVGKKLGEVGQEAEGAGEQVSSFGNILSGFGTFAGLATTAVGALAVGFQQWAKNAQNLKYASSEIGVSANSLYQFQQAASRLNIEDPTEKMAKFSKRMLGVQLDWGSARRYFAQHKIEDLFEGLRADLNNPEWDNETRMEKSMQRVGNYIKELADQGRWQEANKLAKDFFGGMGAQKVIDLMAKQNELAKEGVEFTQRHAEIAQQYTDIIADVKSAWQEAVVASVPFFGKAMDMMKSLAGAVDTGSLKALKDLVMGTNVTGDTVWDKILKVLDPGLYDRFSSQAKAQKVIEAAPTEEKLGLEFDLLTGERKGLRFEQEKAKQQAEWWGQAPIREQAPALTPDVQAQLEAQGATFGGPERQPIGPSLWSKLTGAAAATPEAQAPVTPPSFAPELVRPAGEDVGAAVVEGVKQNEDAAEEAGKSLGSRVWNGLKGYFGGTAGAAEAFDVTKPLGGRAEAEPAAAPAPEPAPAFFKGGGWEEARTEGPSPFDVLQVPPGQEPIDLARAAAPTQTLEPSPELTSLLRQEEAPRHPANAFMVPGQGTEPPLSAQQVLAPQDQQGFNWDGFQYDKMGAAMAQETTVNGAATVTVDVRAPQGTKIGGQAKGLFKQMEIKRGRQMAWSADAEQGDDWT